MTASVNTTEIAQTGANVVVTTPSGKVKAGDTVTLTYTEDESNGTAWTAAYEANVTVTPDSDMTISNITRTHVGNHSFTVSFKVDTITGDAAVTVGYTTP